MVIQLSVRTSIDLEALEAGVAVHLIRVTASIRLMTSTGWSHPCQAILDTGNPVSLVPQNRWQVASVSFLTSMSFPVYGLGATAETAIRGRLGRVMVCMDDARASTPLLETVAYLLDDDRAPLVLGCGGILTRAVLRAGLGARQASLEF